MPSTVLPRNKTDQTSSYGGKNPGQPLYAFIAICISAGIYAIVWITLLIIGAKVFKEENSTYFFMFNLIANISVVAMIVLDFFYVRYRFSYISLTVSLLYCGSACLIICGLIWGALYGIPLRNVHISESQGLFGDESAGGAIACWVLDILAVGLQISGHYFYG